MASVEAVELSSVVSAMVVNVVVIFVDVAVVEAVTLVQVLVQVVRVVIVAVVIVEVLDMVVSGPVVVVVLPSSQLLEQAVWLSNCKWSRKTIDKVPTTKYLCTRVKMYFGCTVPNTKTYENVLLLRSYNCLLQMPSQLE